MELCTSTLVDTLKANPNGVPIYISTKYSLPDCRWCRLSAQQKDRSPGSQTCNVFIKEGIMKIGDDFNIPKEIGKGVRCWSPFDYCPPEQRLIHRLSGDYRVHLWSVGVIYFHFMVYSHLLLKEKDIYHNIEFIHYPPITKGGRCI